VRPLLAAITLVSLITITIAAIAPSPPPFASCSCAAEDGSCDVTGNCPQGCFAYCPSGRCRFICAGGGYEEMLEMSALITLEVTNGDSHRVAAELKRLTGAEVIFNPRRPDATFTLNVRDEPLWNVLDTLSSEGSLQIAKEDFGHLKSVRQSFLSGERMSVCFQKVTAKRLATDLSFLTGLDVHVEAGNPKTLIYYTGQGVNLQEIVAQVSQGAGVQLAVR